MVKAPISDLVNNTIAFPEVMLEEDGPVLVDPLLNLSDNSGVDEVVGWRRVDHIKAS